MLVNDLAPTISLDGEWDFALGESANWSKIYVPGCWEAQGHSKWVDGPARYRRTVFIPETWREQPIYVQFDAVSYACTVRCNGVTAGQHQGMWTPFALNLSHCARPGEPNMLEIEVHRPGVQPNAAFPMRTTLAGFLPDVATPLGGLWQSARLVALPVGIDGLRIDADPATGSIHLRGQAPGLPDIAASEVHMAVRYQGQPIASNLSALDPAGGIETEIVLDEPALWSPTTPALYTVHLTVQHNGQTVAAYSQRIGFRRLAVDGEQLLLNGEPICLRGALSWGWDPALIAPAFTPEQVRAEIRRVRSLGFNLIKLCLFIPNQTYYDIADEEGMLLWQEFPLWLPHVTDALRARAPQEYADYMALTRHHPSVVLYSLGCELSHAVDGALLGQLNDVVRAAVDNVLFCDNSGSGEAYGGLAVDFADFTDYHTYGDLHFLEPVLDHWRRDWQPPRPWIFGEFCDCDGFRDLSEIRAANNGVAPWWMTSDIWTHTWRPEVQALLEAEARLAEADCGFSTSDLVQIAAAQAFTVRKYTLEAVRKRSGVKGYVITGLRDTPIATSGVFDDLDRPKWPAEAFRRINDDAILCLDAGRSRIWQYGGDRPERLDPYNWWAGEPVCLHIILNHTMAQAQEGGQCTWQVAREDGATIAQGQSITQRTLDSTRPAEVGIVEFVPPPDGHAQQFTLHVRFDSTDIHCANQWPLWSYPQPAAAQEQVRIYDPPWLLDDQWAHLGQRIADGQPIAPTDVVITSILDEQLLAHLHDGGAALLLQQRNGPLPARRLPFWRESLKLLAPHPIWQRFPHQGHTDMQFFGLAADVAFDTAQLTTSLPGLYRWAPILRRMDAREFFMTEYLFEAQIGKGRLIGCTLRLQGGAGAQPTGLQRNVAGRFLLDALCTHLSK